ncbi:hypothetical protein ANCDUO_15403 [Ancylostoma duodenale]|uniref:Phosducin n=1 Tax=Ancylostoma duodenale TaxID=51022 RepID=A0A0C2GBW3_9BILA|nr:hypothetical protein ANCDUO_15403 [Ancylostoma duodenale]
MNTGAKGVLNEFAAHQEQAKRIKEAKDREVLRLARKGMLQGSKAERDQDQFTKAIDTCESLLCVLIYEPNDEMCEKMTHVCKTEQALPTLQFYLNGNLIGNFIKVPSLLGGEIDVDSVRKFVRRQHIDLVYGNYMTDSDCSTDEELD